MSVMGLTLINPALCNCHCFQKGAHDQGHQCKHCMQPLSLMHHVLICRPEEEAEFKAFAAQPDMLGKLADRIAPSIFGHENIKKAVACLLFGGARKVRHREMQKSAVVQSHCVQLLCTVYSCMYCQKPCN